MAVTANQILRFEGNAEGLLARPVAAAKRLYQATMAFVIPASGYTTDVIAAGVNKFAGIVKDEIDNSAGANGDKTAECYTRGRYVLKGSGFTPADVEKLVYAVDNFTISLTLTAQSLVGTAKKYISATEMLVELESQV